MAYVCEICSKKTVVGRSQKHKRGVAGKRWKKRVAKTFRLFRPNIQKKTVKIGNKTKQMKICAKCLKSVKKYGKVKNFKNISVS